MKCFIKKILSVRSDETAMQIQDFFINGDMKGAIAYMREHQEFGDILPAYIAVFENCQYRTYDVPEFLNQILLQYQVYYRDFFIAGCRRQRPLTSCESS